MISYERLTNNKQILVIRWQMHLLTLILVQCVFVVRCACQLHY